MAPKLVNGQVGYIEIPAVDIQRSADFYVKVSAGGSRNARTVALPSKTRRA